MNSGLDDVLSSVTIDSKEFSSPAHASASSILASSNQKSDSKSANGKDKNTKDGATGTKLKSTFGNLIKYIIFATVVILAISVTVYFLQRTYKTQNKNLGALLESARKDEAILSGKVKALEQEKQQYMRRLAQLNNELQMQQAQPYSSTLPMTKYSYDAPDPNKEREKPQLLKNKEAIKAMVNSKRPTVQDEIDEREAMEREAESRSIRAMTHELEKQTHDSDYKSEEKKQMREAASVPQEVDDSGDGDKKVDELMALIQSN